MASNKIREEEVKNNKTKGHQNTVVSFRFLSWF